MEAELNQVTSDPFAVTDASGSDVTGLVIGNFTLVIRNPSGVDVTGTVSPSLVELGEGAYKLLLTPSIEGLYTSVLKHATYGRWDGAYHVNDNQATIDSVETKVDTIDGIVDDILIDTDTMEADLITEINANETKIEITNFHLI